jgi:hypothetical protein
MDNLFIKMIANKSKLKDDESAKSKSLDGAQVTRLFQILEQDVITNTTVQEHFEDFVAYFRKYMPVVISSFEKRYVVGKFE